jgi:hypothetical protein
MKQKLFSTVVLLITFILMQSINIFAQDQAAAQKAMADYMTPGKMQNMLAKNVGDWKTQIKIWMQPGAEPVISEGTSHSEMLLGGRYLQTTHAATFMGMPMNGIGIDAFDNGRQVFVSVWIDNMGTGVLTLEGKYDEPSKSLFLSGKMFDPVSGKELKVREVVKFVDENRQTMEMYAEIEGKEFKSMEIEMNRVK